MQIKFSVALLALALSAPCFAGYSCKAFVQDAANKDNAGKLYRMSSNQKMGNGMLMCQGMVKGKNMYNVTVYTTYTIIGNPKTGQYEIESVM